MHDRTTLLLAVGLFILLVLGCTTKTAPPTESMSQEKRSSPDTAKAKSLTSAAKQRVTLYVEGMTKVQGIT
jgi:hypothetical protein